MYTPLRLTVLFLGQRKKFLFREFSGMCGESVGMTKITNLINSADFLILKTKLLGNNIYDENNYGKTGAGNTIKLCNKNNDY